MSNPFSMFLNLLPKQVKYIGKITRIETTGIVEIQGIDEVSTSLVKGGTDSYIVGDTVFIVDGVIVSKLPVTQAIVEQSVI